MTKTSTQPENMHLPELPACPVGESDCAALTQIQNLRRSLEELSQLVRTDPLTGIANYRFFVMALEQEIERTQRNGQPTSLIMLDIDFFKKVNDDWGHEIGNQALIHVSQQILETVRKLDITCRYGGEEFAVILPNTELAASIPVANRIRQQIADSPLQVGDKPLVLTASLGIDTFLPGQSCTPEELVQRADHYLYQAKQQGRNQVCHASLKPLDMVSREEREVLFNLFGRNDRKKDAE
ncbi:MAG TPA: GGDEF domain-containing protein [Malonomonas sp.]